MPVGKFHVEGLVCAPCTPFKENGDVDLEAIAPYVDHLVEYGTPNAYVCGTTGEGNNMSVEERKAVAEAWIKHGKGKLNSIIIHIGAGNLRDSQNLARHAESIGASAIACVATSYHKPEAMDDYVEYMKEVAAEAPNTPFLLYDINFFTGINFDVNEFFHKAKKVIPTLRGVKHTTQDLPSINMIVQDHPEMEVLLGTDEYFLEGLVIGVTSSVMDSFLGPVLNRIKEAYDRGDMETARKEQAHALELGKIRRKHKMFNLSGVKCILRALGLRTGQPRLPVPKVSDEAVATMKKEMERIGFFQWGTKK